MSAPPAKTYSDSTSPATLTYDQSSVTIGSWSSPTLQHPVGRLVKATTTSSGSVNTAVVYSYDPMGRVANFWQCNASNCSSIWDTQYNYDKAGDITSWVHPAGYTLTNTLNSAQQVTAVQSSRQDSTHPQYLAQNATYTAWGALSGLQNGCAGSGCTNVQETYVYNKRLQPWLVDLGTSASPSADYCLVYNYYSSWTPPSSCPSTTSTAPSGSTDNGNIMGYWYNDTANTFSHTAAYTYDGVNRLMTAVATPVGNGTASYNLTFESASPYQGYDSYGNMTCVTNAQTNGPCPSWAYNSSTNQLTTSNCTYDAAGNLTKDCSTAAGHTYQWDAEGRVASVNSGSTWTFTYNALGDRVQSTNSGGTSQYLFDPAGNWLGIAGSYTFVPFGGRFGVFYEGSGTYFNHVNNLGSTMMLTSYGGAVAEDVMFYPWGQLWQSSGSGGYTFAGMPYDTTTNTYFTAHRFYSPGLGRWLSTDPVGGGTTNPQSLNRYPYVMNTPLTSTDPLGLTTSSICLSPNHIMCNTNPWGDVSMGPYGFPSCTADGIAMPCSMMDTALESGGANQCPNNVCEGWGTNAQGQVAYEQFQPTITNPNNWTVLSSPVPDPSLSIIQINAAYQLGCQYATFACGVGDSVSVRYVGSTYNVTLNGNPLDKDAAAEDGYQDPTGSFHNGDSSWYIGLGGLLGIDEGHVVDATQYGGVEAHYDTFGPYNPLHWVLEALPSLFINTRGSATPVQYTCSINGGCQ